MFSACTLQAQHFASSGKNSPAVYQFQYGYRSLRHFLLELEQEYAVQFAYDGELVNGIKVNTKIVKGQGLENLLDKALESHELQYKKIGEKLYYGLNSYFGRINYGLLEKYLITVTGRIDGSFKFGAANRYAEVLLIYAEASNELSVPSTEAYEAVNKIRRRAEF